MNNENHPGHWPECTPLKPSEREALLAHIRNFMEKAPTEDVFLRREDDTDENPEKCST